MCINDVQELGPEFIDRFDRYESVLHEGCKGENEAKQEEMECMIFFPTGDFVKS